MTTKRASGLVVLVVFGLLAGCVQTPPPRSGAQPNAPRDPRRLTDAELAAIPNAFPVTLVPPKTRELQSMYESFTKVNPMLIGDLVSKLVDLEHVFVPIVVEECGVTTAQYDPHARQIKICYEFVVYANQLAGRTGADLAVVDRDTNALLVFVTLHEIGHALVDVLALAIEGSEEDRVDELAFLLLTNVRDAELARSVMFAPVAFFPRHGKVVTERDTVHSAGGERSFQGVCLLFGRMGDLEAKRILGGRARACADWTITIRDLWRKWLRPYSRVVDGRTI